MKYLIVGLGNPGKEYEHTRHNIGFDVVDSLAAELKADFEPGRHALVARSRFAGKSLVLIKPLTFMNLSGKAVKYWLQKENIPLQNMLVILDDLALPPAQLRMRKKGGDGNHNGLSDIIAALGRNDFPRLRFGIGNDFPRGMQADYVLGKWKNHEQELLPPAVDKAVAMIKSFIRSGADQTMNAFN